MCEGVNYGKNVQKNHPIIINQVDYLMIYLIKI